MDGIYNPIRVMPVSALLAASAKASGYEILIEQPTGNLIVFPIDGGSRVTEFSQAEYQTGDYRAKWHALLKVTA